jgi:hypothetical protein
VAAKPQIRGRILLAVLLPLLLASVWEILGLRTHVGAWNHRLDPGYEWCALPVAKIEISNMQQGLNGPYYHPGPHIRWPGFEYVQVYREFRIPWRANISTFYTMALPIAVLAAFFGRRALRRCGTASSG